MGSVVTNAGTNGNGTAEPEPMIVDDSSSPQDLDPTTVPATELEESKGGVKFEIILQEPKCSSPPRVASPAVFSAKSTPEISAELLQKKILAAAERRQSFESKRLSGVSKHLLKVDEAVKKRTEEEANFIKETKENLEQKIKVHNGNRETIITGLKTKLNKHHTNHLMEVRQSLETSMTEQEEKTKAEIISKLETAEKNREKVLQEKLESLKKHDEKVELVRTRSAQKMNTSMEVGDGEELPAVAVEPVELPTAGETVEISATTATESAN